MGILFLLAGMPACDRDAPDPSEAPAPPIGFAHLVRGDGGFESTHGLPYRFAAPAALVPVGPLHRTDRFHGVPYEISLAGFVSDEAAILVHAERVADGSGASDYDVLDPAPWPDDRFRTSGLALVTVPAEERDAEHDLRWLHANGFDPVGTLAVQQYFATTADHDDEIVVTLMRHVTEGESPAPEGDPLAVLRAAARIAPVASTP